MNLANLLSRNLVKIPLESTDSEEAIAELVELLVRAGKIRDRQGLLDALYMREAKGSTGIGGGVAIPHARHPEVETVALVVGVRPEGIEYDSVDGEPVRLIFLLVAAPNKPGLNVEALADIGDLVRVPGVCQKLINADNASELINVIEKAQLSK